MDDIETLLTPDGLQALKLMCVKNLHMKAKDTDEVGKLNRFMERAKEVSVHISLHVLLNNFQNGWLIKTSA